ncbi:MAG: betaine-aldehyde dehydrogenase [Sulfobacillus benefaciens]|uniref:Betaine-aldehyde dehydrogenase n=1 Tax=Sulfobacillus benefaciens TaxID=453960 RepID=A0A2T2XKY3_9FIRM|nr:MAG: betaine-aldehyde dehydrogenase [Sulfobacillus benefaciens]
MVAKHKMYIGGRWVESRSGTWFEVYDPGTGTVLATVPEASADDVDDACRAARTAFDSGIWSKIAERTRARVLFEAANIVRRRRDDLAVLEVQDSGKPLRDALADIDEAAYILEYYAGWVTKLTGEVIPVGPEAMSLVLREPMGVVAAIVPWNYPFLMAVQKTAPALAAGCSVVLKPAEQTPLTALLLPEILEEAGLPPGVFNVVTGDGIHAGESLVRHPLVDKVSFTGSLEVGKRIQRVAADSVKRVTLELGGKSPAIIFADADLSRAVPGTCFGVFWNQGEVCSATARVYVEDKIYDRVVASIAQEAAKVRLGSGLDPEATMGPLISHSQKQRVESYIRSAQEEGAELVVQGALPANPALAAGYFVPPTVFAGAASESAIMTEEIFGPVMAIRRFHSESEVIAAANNSPYGLAASVWTQQLDRALRLGKALRAGTVWINDSQPAPSEAPWGGYKQSGFGRELGKPGLEEFMESKHLYLRIQ